MDFNRVSGIGQMEKGKLILMLCLLAGFVHAATVIDDHFDDGAIGTNVGGVGSGFTAWADSGVATPTESDTYANYTASSGWTVRSGIYSNDSFTVNGNVATWHYADGASVGYRVVSSIQDQAAATPDTNRFSVNICGSTVASRSKKIWIAAVIDGLQNTYEEVAHGLDTSRAFSVSAALTDAGYTVWLTGTDTGGGAVNTEYSGDWVSGKALSDILGVDGVGYAGAWAQYNVAVQLDQLVVQQPSGGSITVSPNALEVSEEGETFADYQFELSEQPTDDVTISLAYDTDQITVSDTELLFTQENWQTPQVVCVTAIDDLVREDTQHEIQITHDVTTASGSNYDGANIQNVTVTILDNDCGAWGYSYADMDEDCLVNIQDFALLASGWLSEDLISMTDINSDGVVNVSDIDLLSSQWLACSFPNNENCQNYTATVPIVQLPDIEYKLIDGYSLKMYYRYEPEVKEGPLPCAVFFFGGGWTGGDPFQMEEHCKYFASKGIICMSADYRVKNTQGTTPFECVKDGKSAVRWIRANAAALGVDPDKIIAGGASAGGHVAACTDIIVGYEEEGEDTTVSSRPNALFLLNPVVDTTEDGYGSEKFDEGEDTLISPVHHIVSGICPTIIFHGTADTTVPFENVERFTQLMHDAGNRCKLVPFEGENHGFFNHINFQGYRDPADFDTTVEMGYEFFLIHGF